MNVKRQLCHDAVLLWDGLERSEGSFTALVRFDPVYAPLFRIGGKRLSEYTALTAFVSRVYDIPGIAETVRFDHILAHYFDSDWSIPSRRGIVPNLTEMSWYRPPEP
jgi:putative glutathione S-transferase